ncbi:hypothetical protein, conserved [Plasmodium gonderi]|uniref:Uncharacterized protein n=1 Tax=Plasmodium gonderi TaxID=77519 RepID=A0A1Y1JQW7_PLAGO|nr:hypothetical protein, conserved [Plasmodium gonderi]GAW82444.1 hypothetical protein, conserved [Plasmodium gonderi]
MKIVHFQINGETYLEAIMSFLQKNQRVNTQSVFTNALGSLYKNEKRNYFIVCPTQEHTSKGCEQKEETACINYKKDIKDTTLQNIKLSVCEKAKKQVSIHNNTNMCKEVKEKWIKESLKKYNLFNVYLDKIKKSTREKKKNKIININSVIHYDEYVHMFDINSLLIHAKDKLRAYKKKRQISMNNNFFIHFLKIFIRLNIILNDFFSCHGEIKFRECYTSIFNKYLKNIPLSHKKTQQKIYDQTFFINVLQLVKIFNQIHFFKTLKSINISYVLNNLTLTVANERGSIYKQEESNFSKSIDYHKLFYEYMTNDCDENVDKEKFNTPGKSNFMDNLNIFGNKLEDLNDIDDAKSFFFYKKEKIKKNSLHSGGEENVYLLRHDINKKSDNLHKEHLNNSQEGRNELHNTQVCENELRVSNDKKVHDHLNKNNDLLYYLSLTRGFSYILKSLIKHLDDDGVVRLFIHCSNLFDRMCTDKEVLSLYTKMYERIKKMKNISNKNLAYILSACNNYFLKEENIDLLKHLKKDILCNRTNLKNNAKKYLNICNITPSHLENIIYTFSKNKLKEKELFILFSEIVKEKCHGFSCITTINILNSYTILNYESLIFDFLYAKIKSFDLISFMMCKGRNVIKLINTLLLIEHRNFERCHNNRSTQSAAPAIDKTGGNNSKRNALTDIEVYVTLISSLIYELKTFKGENSYGSRNSDDCGYLSKLNNCGYIDEQSILSIYKKMLRLQIISLQSKPDWTLLKNIFRRNYDQLNIEQFDSFFVFSFINFNLNKINFHKLLFTLLTYNNLIHRAKFSNNYKQTKKKFI